MAQRALELLNLPEDGIPKIILDLGCGSGLSGAVIEERGDYWIGMDISKDMLEIAHQRRIPGSDGSGSGSDGSGADGGADTDLPIIPEYGKLDEEYYEEDDDDNDNDEEEDEDDYDSDSYSDNDVEMHKEQQENPELCLDLFLNDMGRGVSFRPGSFDGCVSISALQWLCHSNRKGENPKTRLMRLFNTLFGCLSRGARAVFQFYPESSSQIDLILSCSMKAGFTGGLVVDYPNSSRAKKYYLCLMTGATRSEQIPSALMEPNTNRANNERIVIDKRSKKRFGAKKAKKGINTLKKWVQDKKDLQRKRGEKIKADSKYTARKRKARF